MRNKLTDLKLANLAKRREHLIAEAAAQRLMLKQQIEPLRAPLILLDRGISAVRYVKNHPAWALSTSVALLTVARPSRLSKWLQRGWVTWQVLCRLRARQ